MKIGIDLRMYSSHFTGIGRYCYELVEHLLALDTENDYVFFLNDPEYVEFCSEKRLLLEDGRTKPDGTKQSFKAVLVNARHYSYAEQIGFLMALNKEKLDIMHFTHFNAPLFYFGKKVVTIHDLTLSFFPGKKMTKWYHRLGYHIVLLNIVRSAKKIVCVSKHTAIDLGRLFNFTRKKSVTIHEAVGSEFRVLPLEEVGAVMNKYGIDKEYILYTGVHRDHKNIVGLIGAFSILVRDHGFGGYLVVTGKEDPCYPEVKATVEKLKLTEKVKLVGLVDEEDLIAMYNGASVYAYPSFYEGFGLPALEAFACGVPVCASKNSCIPEVCGDGAHYFDPSNLEDIAVKLSEVLSDEALRNALVEHGTERLKMFSWEQMAKETLEVYKEAGVPTRN